MSSQPVVASPSVETPVAADAAPPPPPALVGLDGRVATGSFSRPVRDVNLEDAAIPHAGAFVARLPVVGPPIERRLLRPLRLKCWCYLSFTHEDVFLGVAFVDVGYLKSFFAYVYDRRTRRHEERSWLLPPWSPRGSLTVPTTSVAGRAAFARGSRGGAGGDRADLVLEERPAPGGRLTASLPSLGEGGLEVDLRFDAAGTDPLVVASELPGGRYTYTHKATGFPVEGTLRTSGAGSGAGGGGGGRTIAFERGRDLANIDYTRGYLLRHTVWNWAMAAGRTQAGRKVGWSFARHPLSPSFAENGIWIDGALARVPGPVEFLYDERDPAAPWRVETPDGRVRLVFRPEGAREEHVRLGLISSDFRQPFGAFEGEVADARGERHAVRDVFGVVEAHDSWW